MLCPGGYLLHLPCDPPLCEEATPPPVSPYPCHSDITRFQPQYRPCCCLWPLTLWRSGATQLGRRTGHRPTSHDYPHGPRPLAPYCPLLVAYILWLWLPTSSRLPTRRFLLVTTIFFQSSGPFSRKSTVLSMLRLSMQCFRPPIV
jgi:hypothetical protein